jgi:integrase
MKGSIGFRQTGEGGYYYISWYIGKKQYKVNKYKGMICRHKSMAERLLAVMRSDDESGFFRIQKYTKQETNVIPFLLNWIDTRSHLSPATKKDYLNSINNHLIPWFEKHNDIMLHEIQYDVLGTLLNDIKRVGKGKQNVMYCLHTALLSAVKSGKIQTMPEFPEKKEYGIEETLIKTVTEERQIRIIQTIPIEHQPIFWWLKYHFRRPSEALALHKEDYDEEKDCFIIRRSFSNKKLVQHTKTHKIHIVPCHPEFKLWIEKMDKRFSKYYFTHGTSRLEGKRYQHDYLVDLWNKACKERGEKIRMYAGLKHSSCTAFVNEQGGSVDELQMMTDHARRDSVLKYTEVKLEAKRNIQGKVLRFKQEHSKNMMKK